MVRNMNHWPSTVFYQLWMERGARKPSNVCVSWKRRWIMEGCTKNVFDGGVREGKRTMLGHGWQWHSSLNFYLRRSWVCSHIRAYFLFPNLKLGGQNHLTRSSVALNLMIMSLAALNLLKTISKVKIRWPRQGITLLQCLPQAVLILDPPVTARPMKNFFTFVTINWNFYIGHAVTGGSKINTGRRSIWSWPCS